MKSYRGPFLGGRVIVTPLHCYYSRGRLGAEIGLVHVIALVLFAAWAVTR